MLGSRIALFVGSVEVVVVAVDSWLRSGTRSLSYRFWGVLILVGSGFVRCERERERAVQDAAKLPEAVPVVDEEASGSK